MEVKATMQLSIEDMSVLYAALRERASRLYRLSQQPRQHTSYGSMIVAKHAEREYNKTMTMIGKLTALREGYDA
jgi:hypothetical protein